MTMSYPTTSHAGPSYSGVSKYTVQSTDVLQEVRVNVSEEGSDKVIWYKERFLDVHEIVENVVHNATRTVCWSIHRPLRGWYIRIRSPHFPPGVFIALTPVPPNAPYHVDGAISFSSRTNIPLAQHSLLTQPLESSFRWRESEDGKRSLPGSSRSSINSVHSYPPTPPPVRSPLASPTTPRASLTLGTSTNSLAPAATDTSNATTPTGPMHPSISLTSVLEASEGDGDIASESLHTSSSSISSTTAIFNGKQKAAVRPRIVPPNLTPSTQITQFIFAPTTVQPGSAPSQAALQQQQQATSFFYRALSMLKSSRPIPSNSFTLSRIMQPPPLAVHSVGRPGMSRSSTSSSARSSTSTLNGFGLGSSGGSSSGLAGTETPPPAYASNLSLASASSSSSSSAANSTTAILSSDSGACESPLVSSPLSMSPATTRPPHQGSSSLPPALPSQIVPTPGHNPTPSLPPTTQTNPTHSVLHPTPILTYHDLTPTWTVRSLSGRIEIDRNEERSLGVDTSFWVAVALTYLEFLEERESYLAAAGD